MEKYGVVRCPSCQCTNCADVTRDSDDNVAASTGDLDLDKVASASLESWRDYKCAECGDRFKSHQP